MTETLKKAPTPAAIAAQRLFDKNYRGSEVTLHTPDTYPVDSGERPTDRLVVRIPYSEGDKTQLLSFGGVNAGELTDAVIALADNKATKSITDGHCDITMTCGDYFRVQKALSGRLPD